MSFFTSPPQPGDGAFLLLRNDRRHRRVRKKVSSFLWPYQDDAEVGQNGEPNCPVGPEATETFSHTSEQEQTSLTQEYDVSGTIAREALLSTSTWEAGARASSVTPNQPHIISFLQSTNESDCAHDIDRKADKFAIDMPAPKFIPPHLRKQNSGKDNHSVVTPVAQGDVREKLSEFSVKVSAPLPADKIEQPSSNESARPPYHGRGRGRSSVKPDRSSRWPKVSEIPKPDPPRWDVDWRSEASSCSSIDSLRADSGFGNEKSRTAAGTDDSRFKLTDWDGSWAPAPIDWDARPAFRATQNVSQIERWMQGVEEDLCGITRAIDLEKDESGDAAPRYWIPIVIGRKAPQTFWSELIKSTAPEPFDEDDLVSAQPWWEQYQTQGGNTLKPYTHPNITSIDPDENLNERLARENDFGSNRHTENRRRTEKAKRDAQREKRDKTQERARKMKESATLDASQERIKPGLNLFVRSARPTDITHIRDIYNHYVDFSVCTPETKQRTTGDMMARYQDIVGNKLPFLVACEQGGKIPNRRKKKDPSEDIILSDQVVGFAFADDYNDLQGMYRFTAEMEVYTDKKYYMKGIAKCLLDKLMALLDPEYVERGGFEIQGEELEGVGPSRVISNVVVNLPYDKPERLEWISKWLSKWLGFQQVGDLKDVGNKEGKSVSLAIFQRKTAAVVDAANPPIMMSYPN